jgi:hypothetical protein
VKAKLLRERMAFLEAENEILKQELKRRGRAAHRQRSTSGPY